MRLASHPHPKHKVADLRPLRIGQPLYFVGRPAADVLRPIVRLDILRPQTPQVVGSHQQREIGKLAAEVRLVPALVEHDFGHAQQDHQIRQVSETVRIRSIFVRSSNESRTRFDLKVTGQEVGVILNFKRARLEWKRVVYKRNANKRQWLAFLAKSE